MRRGGKLYNYTMMIVPPQCRGFAASVRPGGRIGRGWVAWRRVLRSVPVICTSLLLPYMSVTPAPDNGGLVSIDQPEVTL